PSGLDEAGLEPAPRHAKANKHRVVASLPARGRNDPAVYHYVVCYARPLGRHQIMTPGNVREIGARRTRLRQNRQFLLNAKPPAALHPPEDRRSVRHRSCATASSSSEPASRLLCHRRARGPSPDGYVLTRKKITFLCRLATR